MLGKPHHSICLYSEKCANANPKFSLPFVINERPETTGSSHTAAKCHLEDKI